MWALGKAELIAAAEEPNVNMYNIRRTAEMTTRIEVDLARLELDMHQRVHGGTK
jgi:hypothetical protein